MAQSFLGRNDLPVGLRNNNVGNLRGDTAWQGKVGMSETGNYVQFSDIAWGIRAFLTNLYTQINKYGLDTPIKYISKYAPSGDAQNNPTQYATKLANDLGIGINDKIPTNNDSLRIIVRSQMEEELGKKYANLITDDDVNEGISLLNDKVLSFFGATAIFAKNNSTAIILITLSLAAYIYWLKTKKIV